MPKFRIFKGHDAYVNYEAIVEAESRQAANEIGSWRSTSRDLDWKQNGNINEYDDWQFFEDQTEEVADDEEAPEDHVILTVTGPQRDLILASLRLWQRTGIIPEEIFDIATNGRRQTLLGTEIDTLCEEINR